MDFLQCQEFLMANLRVGEERHLVFATEHQLDILQRAKRWFVDGTFKIVPPFLKPNGQLMSIHAFVQKDGKSMQFPLLFALMSRRRKEDYIEVFRAVLERLENPLVEMVTADFEAGAWQAIREVFPAVVIRGCAFRMDPRAAAWLGENISAAGGDPLLHQTADGLAFLAVDSRT
uniref:Uncharacterized protein LOC111131283 n=1 Tax=Crassostrea virginica TaxID=6565 RepID=A0A8B8E1P0_CRAVI|nr:uncharacterized protein LOC111131283 [Crassostrea virginica]